MTYDPSFTSKGQYKSGVAFVISCLNLYDRAIKTNKTRPYYSAMIDFDAEKNLSGCAI